MQRQSMQMAFLKEPPPQRLAPLPIKPGLSRLVAPNPSPMTYHGTNTWLVDGHDGLTVIDPGPNDAAHIAAITAAGPIARILLTHTHPDHLAGAPALQAATGAPILGWAKPWAKNFTPDIALADGQTIGAFTALHTPGHASDHLCFALPDGTLFSGDHVMSWSTSIVSAPDGDMGAYMDSLRLLLDRQDTLYLCGHGPPLPHPAKLVRAMLLHRVSRENAVLAALDSTPKGEDDLVAQLYGNLAPDLLRPAARVVGAHLLKLAKEGKAVQVDEGWIKA
jgi:glyoxylase-like metal-dependent hydrolase (beta-lactamase superfamily II)